MGDDVFKLAGTVIDDRYRVDAVIGEGGFGVVYRGHHLAFDHAIAIKCLKIPPHFSEEGKSTFLQKFKEEGKILSRLSHHPAIVRVFDLGITTAREERVPYLVLEWLSGEPLAQRLAARRAAGRPFDEREAVETLRPIIEALATVHVEGIAHRDVKPENVFLLEGAKGSPAKLLDFGIAKAMQEGERVTRVGGRTSSNFSAFSPQHGAPEQYRPAAFGATGPWTDVHALGLILAEMTSGKEAIRGQDFGDMLVAATDAQRPTPRTLGGSVSNEFEAMIARCLALDPRSRFQDAGTLLAEIDRIVPVAGRVSLPVASRPSQPQESAREPSRTSLAAPLDSALVPASAGARSTEFSASPLIPISAASQRLTAQPERSGSRVALILVAGLALSAAGAFAYVQGRTPAPRSRPTDTESEEHRAGATPVTASATASVASEPSALAAASSSADPLGSASDSALVTSASSLLSGSASAHKKPPTVRMGATSVSGRLPPEVIQRIVRQNFGRFRLCYENGLRNNPNLAGSVTVSFTITSSGSVSGASGGGSLPDAGVIGCVTKAFYGLSFPQPEGGIVKVSYPISFSPGG